MIKGETEMSAYVELGRIEMGTACGYIAAVEKVDEILDRSGRVDLVSAVVRKAIAEMIWQQIAQGSSGIITEQNLDEAVEFIEHQLRTIYLVE
jgi:hypothetical protein